MVLSKAKDEGRRSLPNKPGGETESKINEIKNKIINKFDYYKAKYNNLDEDDCSFLGVGKKAMNIAIKSNAKNPIKTGNKALDSGANTIPIVKGWNKGFNIGKGVFVAKQTYEDACKNKN